jgi:hypothetical protein
MDKVRKHNSFNTNTPSSESYRNYGSVGSKVEIRARTRTHTHVQHFDHIATSKFDIRKIIVLLNVWFAVFTWIVSLTLWQESNLIRSAKLNN